MHLVAQGEHALLVGQRQCSFATGALLIAQELHISVILLEIRGGAVGIVFTGFGTLVIKAQKVCITSESGPQYHILGVMIVCENGGRSVSRQMSQYERNQCSERVLKRESNSILTICKINKEAVVTLYALFD